MRVGEIVEFNTFLAVAEAGRFASAAVRVGCNTFGRQPVHSEA